MRVAVASMGTAPDALVGIRFGTCSQFLTFDLDTMECAVLSVPPCLEPSERVNLGAIRAVAKQGVSVVITGHIKEICRQTLLDLGIEVIEGVESMTVNEAVERYKATGLTKPRSREGTLTRVAVASRGEGLDARLELGFGTCVSFLVVDPRTKKWEAVRVELDEPARKVNLKGIRAVVRSGAGAIITRQIDPACCMALQALAVIAYVAPGGITVREAVELYARGELEEARPS